ncbi:hypothetical protein [Elizabethkingia meningoseptica]|uniref:hypothetical protein n=1 Tax=Elizabethkingia meningoseptica TaxID=238 RepID=UPI0023B09E92|nr:hypothetical protein [Elizabethkingia meningoseptica]MDE5492238.1 hypothetical protein [Elizabethkingia meningoseptica]
MTEKDKIPAIFKEDLQKLLQSINEKEPIEKGERLCKVCSKVISLENIQLIIPRQGNTFDFICDSPVCVEEYNRKKKL